MTQKTLYLASTSASRQLLLKEALIPFIVVGHSSDEQVDDTGLSFLQLLQSITRHKMERAGVPAGTHEGQIVYVLAADSMGKDVHGVVHGKPKDRADAIAKLKVLAQGATTATAFCIDKKIWEGGKWKTLERVEKVVEARYKFVVPENWIDRYLEHSWAMIASGAIAVELYGAQFLDWIDGSYSAVMGLPMVELRQALEHLGFFD